MSQMYGRSPENKMSWNEHKNTNILLVKALGQLVLNTEHLNTGLINKIYCTGLILLHAKPVTTRETKCLMDAHFSEGMQRTFSPWFLLKIYLS